MAEVHHMGAAEGTAVADTTDGKPGLILKI
jgi:hypothetical protein